MMLLTPPQCKAIVVGFAVDGVLCSAAAYIQGVLAVVRLARRFAPHVVSGNDLLLVAGLLVAVLVVGVSFLAEMDISAEAAKKGV